MPDVLWKLTYRSPLAPTKGVHDVLILTNTDDEARARLVAQYWLDKGVAHPSTRFITIERAVAQTEAKMLQEIAAAGKVTEEERAAKPNGSTARAGA